MTSSPDERREHSAFHRIIATLVGHETLANLIFVVMILSGLLAWSQIRVQFFPDVVLEKVRVSITWSGASAQEIDSAVMAVIEPALRETDGVTETETDSISGSGTLTIAFEPGTRMDIAAQRVRDAINRLSDVLPQDIGPLDVRAGLWRDEASELVLYGDLNAEQLAFYSGQLTTALYDNGVTRVSVTGVSAGSFRVNVPQEQLYRQGLDINAIAARIGGDARVLPAGTLSGAMHLSLGTSRRSEKDLESIVLRRVEGERPLLLGDIAQIERINPIEQGTVRYRGLPAVDILVQRGAGEDAVAIQRAVEAVLSDFAASAPEGVRTEVIRSRTALINDQIGQLGRSALIGAGLVLLALYLTLSPRIALWVITGIPISLLIGIVLLVLFGHTINMLSLLAMSISVGMIVDDAIIIAENADFRVHKLGEPPSEAVLRAAVDMLPLVLAATLTTIFAFSVIAVISGEFGAFVRDIPFTVAAVMLGSTLECFLVLPRHLSHALKHANKGQGVQVSPASGLFLAVVAGAGLVYLAAGLRFRIDGPIVPMDGHFTLLPFLSATFVPAAPYTLAIGAATGAGLWLLLNLRNRFSSVDFPAPRHWINNRLEAFAETILRPALTLALRLRYAVLILMGVALAGSVWLVRSGVVDWQFFRSPESTTLFVNVTMQDKTSPTDTLKTIEALEQRLTTEMSALSKEVGHDLVLNKIAIAGGRFGPALEQDFLLEQHLMGTVAVQFSPFRAGDPTLAMITKRIDARISDMPGIVRRDYRSADLSPAGAGVHISLFADDPVRLKAAVDALSDRIRALPAVFELRDTIPDAENYGVIELRPRAAYLGFSENDIRQALRNRLNGVEAFSYAQDGRRGSVSVRLPNDERTAAALRSIWLSAADGTLVPLQDIVRIVRKPGLSVIRRSNGQPSASVIGRLDSSDPRAAEATLRQIRNEILPEITARFGVTSGEAGLARQEKAFLHDAVRGGLLCILGIYATLVLALRSWSHPLVILITIPFVLIGVVFGHFIWMLPVSMFSILGVFGLAGVVINDAIVLMTVLRQQDDTVPMHLRAVEAATLRFRAIFLTTATTLLGLLPILYTQNLQADFLSPIVITLFYGLGAGMVIVLLCVPLLATVFDDIRRVTARLL